MAETNSAYSGPFKPTPWDEELTKLEADSRAALFDSAEDYGWQPFSHKKEGVQSWFKVIEECPAPILKSATTIPATVEQVRRVLSAMDKRPLWKEKFTGGDIIQSFDPATVQFAYTYSPPWPSAPRDFNVIFRTILLPPVGAPEGTAANSYLMIGKSIVSDNYPEKDSEGLVRGNVLLWAYYCTPNKENAEHCDLIYVSANDPKGSIPKMLLSGFKGSVTDMIYELKTDLFVDEKKKAIVSQIYDYYGEQMAQRLKDFA